MGALGLATNEMAGCGARFTHCSCLREPPHVMVVDNVRIERRPQSVVHRHVLEDVEQIICSTEDTVDVGCPFGVLDVMTLFDAKLQGAG